MLSVVGFRVSLPYPQMIDVRVDEFGLQLDKIGTSPHQGRCRDAPRGPE